MAKIPEVLRFEDPAYHRNMEVLFKIQEGALHALPIGPDMDFRSMIGKRKPCTIDDVMNGLKSDGFLAANLGISVALTVGLDDENYFAMTGHTFRGDDIGDYTSKLISGYVHMPELWDLDLTGRTEMAQEFFLRTQDEKLVRGAEDGRLLPEAYRGDWVEYAPCLYQIFQPGGFMPDGFSKRKLIVGGKPLEGTYGLYFQGPTNSAQVVVSRHVNLPKTYDSASHKEQSLVEKMAMTLDHAEDGPPGESGMLETKRKRPIVLVKMKDGDLTEEVYNLKDGKLEEYHDPLTFSEALAPGSPEGFIEAPHITHKDYLAGKK